jgi:hypothetical protein
MALQPGAHPAQIRDAVTSECYLEPLLPLPDYDSAWWMYYRRFVGSRRWQNTFHDRQGYPNRN